MVEKTWCFQIRQKRFMCPSAFPNHLPSLDATEDLGPPKSPHRSGAAVQTDGALQSSCSRPAFCFYLERQPIAFNCHIGTTIVFLVLWVSTWVCP